MARRDKTSPAFFPQLQAREKAGFPRHQGRDRYHSFMDKAVGAGATLAHGFVALATVGRLAARWSPPRAGTLKTVTISRTVTISPEVDGWSAGRSGVDVPVRPLPATGGETGIDLGIDAFATRCNGARIFAPGWCRQAKRALKTDQRRVSRRKKGSHRRRKAVQLLARAQQNVRRQRADIHRKTARVGAHERHDLS